MLFTAKDGLVLIYTWTILLVGQAGFVVDPWLQYGSLGVLALYIFLHWLERKDQRRRMEPALLKLASTMESLKVLLNERLPNVKE